ncbi:aminobutyraldehyde dehydrogenase [Solicola gregarius]|uniref:Aminobutyraldehyde dehydrogenase n=1 Tax=Solicola gregarius TaxID=2908642 RepID=A0AA46YL19_9ACTN|nr:aminobutyraldehyde dehydrogenase [Solicola gregarius]UYM04438.1 aminobutyraldehyde dehydrogenase [Solicola gregarius]
MFDNGHQYIAGELRTGTGDRDVEIVNPATGAVLATPDLASAADVDAAVRAARDGYATWSRVTPAERSDAMHAFAAELRTRSEDLARAETLQTGKPIRMSRDFDIAGSIDNVAFFAGTARHLPGLASGEYSGEHTSTIRREPIGVVGSIAPWNYPLQMAAWKVLPAIAAGNTIVLKAAEITPYTALMFAEAATTAGIPAGVINVLTGTGPVAGEALVGHRDVSMVSFTGSTAVGTRVGAIAAGAAKRVHLELGGKAPLVVFDDADLDAAIHGAVAGSCINTGQDCTAATRAIVHESLYDAFCDGVADIMASMRLGDPHDDDTDLGPLSSQRHLERVRTHVEKAKANGATVRSGSLPRGAEYAEGSFFPPTLVTGIDRDAAIMHDEVFGPVLAAVPFGSDDEALEIANDTPYGLAASAWTRDLNRANRASREIQAGCVWINDHIPIISEMPHGGYKQSGFGKDMSAYSFEEYTQVKHVMVENTAVPRKDWHRIVFADRSGETS